MNCRAVCMVSHRQYIIGVGVTGNLPGPFVIAFAVAIQADMLRVLVSRGIHHNIVEPEVVASLHYPYGDFAPVCYEDFIGHYNLSV